MSEYKKPYKSPQAFMSVIFSDRNDDGVTKIQRMPAEQAIENLIMIADTKYNLDILRIYERLKREGKI